MVCIQVEENNERVEQHQRCKTLKPSYLYLELMSSFNQMIKDKHLIDVKEVGVTLRSKCNT